MHKIKIFPWDKRFETGIALIDQQHRILVDLVNQLANQHAYPDQTTDTAPYLDQLLDYAAFHFEAEEAIWQTHLGADASCESHEQSHHRFFMQIQKRRDIADNNPESLLDFLVVWLVDHILKSDRVMAITAKAVASGTPLAEARLMADARNADIHREIVDITLTAYQTLSHNTLWLIRELKARQAAQERIEQLASFNQLILRLAMKFINLDPAVTEQAILTSLEKIGLFLGAHRAYVFRYDFNNGTASNTTEWCNNQITSHQPELQTIPLALLAPVLQKHNKGEPWMVADINSLPEGLLKQLLAKQTIESVVTLPLMHNDHCFGFVGLDLPRFGIERNQENLKVLWFFAQTLEDVESRQESQARLHQAAQVYEHASDGIIIVDATLKIIDANDAYCRISGLSRAHLLGSDWSLLFPEGGDLLHNESWLFDLERSGYWNGELTHKNAQGEACIDLRSISAIKDNDGKVQYYVVIVNDITALRKQQQALQRATHYDHLTSLPNRTLFAQRLRQAMDAANESGRYLAVVYLDIDGFKLINDTYGQNTGNQVLTEITQRLSQMMRGTDTLARLGGDEFVVMLTHLSSTEDCLPILPRLLSAVSRPILPQQMQVSVTCSIGISLYPQTDKSLDAEQLIRQADQAMYHAKQEGKNCFRIFDDIEEAKTREKQIKLKRLQVACDRQEFVLHYQPKVNMRTGNWVGVEALVRWQHPEQGLLPPGDFLPLIHNHYLTTQLGDWVMEAAIQELSRLNDAGLAIEMSINVDAMQLGQADFIDKLKDCLTRHPGARAEQLVLEVLESSALEDTERFQSTLIRGHTLGIKFALDDFGTGYSSLAYLKKLPVHFLKIDQSFVRDMLVDPDDLAILDGTLRLAAAFRCTAVAEGVETEAHGKMLLQMGCELAQGFGIARPMPAEQLTTWAQQWQPCTGWKNTAPLPANQLQFLFKLVDLTAWNRQINQAIAELDQNNQLPSQAHVADWKTQLLNETDVIALHTPDMPAIKQIIRQAIHNLEQALNNQDSRQAEAALTQLANANQGWIEAMNKRLAA